MALPFFYATSIGDTGQEGTLDEDNSRHIAQVLRMQTGEDLLLTDGKGRTAQATLVSPHKKNCRVEITSIDFSPRPLPELTIAISPVKNSSRFEWFLEKATELGTASIIPLLCERSERQHLRYDRLLNICKSAMLQSAQNWLPDLQQPRTFAELAGSSPHDQKMIAHCSATMKKSLSDVFDGGLSSHIILIGPEGDFTEAEILQARTAGFEEVSLGPTRLRTETAGMYAAVICRKKD